MLVTMKEILDHASANNYAVAAPNVWNEADARALVEAAEEMNAPLILDVTYGMNKDFQLIGTLCVKLAKEAKVPVAVNLDHGAKKEYVLEAIKAGFTSVMFDRSSCSFEQNVKEVKEIVEIAHLMGLSVEAELGHVGQAQSYEADRNAALTSVEEAKQYVQLTGVDCLAVAIGTAHGAYPKGMKPYLDFERLQDIKKAVGIPLVLHGSSGTDNQSLSTACKLGINKVNIANDLCKAAIAAVLAADFEGNKSYEIHNVVLQGIKDKLKEMIVVYGSDGKAEGWTTSEVKKEEATILAY